VDEEIDVRDQDGPHEIDLRDRLRFAADALAADFDGQLTADYAEALVFRSAEGLLARASVTEFVPILAERRARLAVRSGGVGVAVSAAAPLAAMALPVVSVSPPAPVTAAPANGSEVAALIEIPVEQLDGLRDRVDRVRARVADWRAEQDSR
jgi:hypothetical protein